MSSKSGATLWAQLSESVNTTNNSQFQTKNVTGNIVCEMPPKKLNEVFVKTIEEIERQIELQA